MVDCGMTIVPSLTSFSIRCGWCGRSDGHRRQRAGAVAWAEVSAQECDWVVPAEWKALISKPFTFQTRPISDAP